MGIGRKKDALTTLALTTIKLSVYGAAIHHDT
jgi:hypothetical protein